SLNLLLLELISSVYKEKMAQFEQSHFPAIIVLHGMTVDLLTLLNRRVLGDIQ
ncbi:unnamed protein product, partial [Urochloa humidicola]